MKSLRRAFVYLRAYWLTSFAALISLLIVTAANLYSPQLLRIVIDLGISAKNSTVLIWSIAALIGLALVRGIFSFAQGYWAEKASQSVAYEMRNALFSKIENLSFSYHDQAQTGQLMTRITSDVEQVRTFIGVGVLQMVSAIALLLGSLYALFSSNWQLALITLLTVPATTAEIGRAHV